MKRLCFFDLDGTLLPKRHKSIPHSTLSALYSLQNRDIGVIVCTGRSFQELEFLGVTLFPFDGYILLNGQLCLDRNFNTLYMSPFAGKDKSLIVDMFNSKEISVALFQPDSYCINFLSYFVTDTDVDIITIQPEVGSYNGGDILMATVYSDNTAMFNDMRTKKWSKHAFDVYPRESGKGMGLTIFSRYYKVPLEKTISFGDAENDIDMFVKSGYSVAMGNASDLVKNRQLYYL